MYRFRWVWFSSLLFLLSVSCRRDSTSVTFETRKFKNTHTLSLVGNPVRFELDSVSLPAEPLGVLELSASGERVLYHLNTGKRVLQTFNWNQKKVENRIALSDEIRNPNYFYARSEDSIFVVDSHAYELFLIDQNGAVKRRFPLAVDSVALMDARFGVPQFANEMNYVALPFPDNRNPIVEIGPYLILKCVPWIKPFQPDYFELGRVRMKVNIQFPNDISYFARYPIVYRMEMKYPTKLFDESSTFNPKRQLVVLSFPADEFVYVMDINGVNTRKYWAGSDRINHVPGMNSFSEDAILQATHAANTPFFERILYDSFRQLYYRMIWLPNPDTRFEFGKPNKEFILDLGVVILDEEFNKVGELVLPKNVSNTFWFASPEGLFIQSNMEDPSALHFQLFEVSKL